MTLKMKFFLQQRLGEFVVKGKQNQNFLFLFLVLGILFFGIYSNYKKKLDRNPSMLKINKILKTNSIA